MIKVSSNRGPEVLMVIYSYQLLKITCYLTHFIFKCTIGEVPDHLSNLKIELERTFANLERKNEMLINAMSKNFGKTH